MKKMLSVIVGISMLLSLAACSEEAKKTNSEEQAITTSIITTIQATTAETTTETTTIAKLTLDEEHTIEDISLKLPRGVTPSPGIPSDDYTFFYTFFNDKSEMRIIVKKNTSGYSFSTFDDSTLQLLLDTYVSSFAESDNWSQNSTAIATKIDNKYALSQELHDNKQLFKMWHFICGENIYSIAFLGSQTNDNTDAISICDDVIKSIKINKTEPITEKATDKPTEPPTTKQNISKGQENALKSAKSYIKFSGFSRDGLIEQLEYEQFSHEDAVYGADNCGADWNAEALESAKSYIKMSGFSYTGLIEQLEYQQFTADQARYGADNCGADWNQQAADSAASYLKSFDFSRDELIDQLLYEGFTQEQAEYGASANGY